MQLKPFLFIVLSSHAVLAAPGAVEKETARRLMEEGRGHEKEKRLAEATDAFRKAHELMQVPTTGLALANAMVEQEQLLEARDLALEVSRIPKEAKEPPVYDQARELAQQLSASLKSSIPTLTIKVQAQPPATNISLDAKMLPAAILNTPLYLNPGVHTVSANNGVATKSEGVQLAEGDRKTLDLVLIPPQPAVMQAESAAAPAISPLVWIGFGVAGAGLITGTVTGVVALSSGSIVHKRCIDVRCDPAIGDQLSNARSISTVSTVSFILAGLGAATGVVGIFLSKGAKEKLPPPSATIAPRITHAAVGLQTVQLNGVW